MLSDGRDRELQDRVERRRASVPEIRYPDSLPITARKDDIVAALGANQVIIVAGETGSGKSTQLPKMCLEMGRGVDGMIGHTQPRRLAARTIAERVADELGSEVGATVGYAVRFTDKVGDNTLIKVMTDGILLNEIQRDRSLRRYDTIIVDEAHERSLNIDFILGYLKQLLPRRPDLKVIGTSATIDTERFSQHFDDAPIVEVSGRTYPVDVRYRPLIAMSGRGGGSDDDAGDGRDGDGELIERDQTQAICDAVDELRDEGPGDVLVFLSGEREIRDTAEALAAMKVPDLEIVPLYARLSSAEQHRVFQPHQGRRVVLATNVAETSLTVPGIRYVVDAGTARISRYNRRTKVQRLPIEAISQASANQRAGRCGRVAAGICIRLYAEDDYESRPEFTEPEILRTNLASVILQMAAIGLGDIAAFPFVDPPDARNIKDGIALLDELGALDPAEEGTKRWLTPIGRQLARLPLDPRLGRMVLEAHKNGCVREVMVIASALSIQDPRERPVGKEQLAAEFHNRFVDPTSDFLGLLQLWEYLREQQRELTGNQFRRLCRAEYLNYLRVREWHDIYSQLRQVTGGLGLRSASEPGDPDRIHMSLLAGLLSHIGLRDEAKRDYQGARGARFAVAPGSALFKKPPRWVMAAELVETNRLWGRVAARIQPEWIERVGGPLLKRSYGEPYWDARRGSAMVNERVALYGLPVVASRPVNYGRVHAADARDMFIDNALVHGDWTTHHAFFRENAELVRRVVALEDRARRRDILVDARTMFDFYDERVDLSVVSGRHFDRWWNQTRAEDPTRLDFTTDFLIDPTTAGINLTDFPDDWRQGDLVLLLSYEFDQLSETDGVTVHVPLVVLNQLTADGFDWHVPGLRTELVTELIKSLPKPVRRYFVPAGDTARQVLERIAPSDGPLLATLERELGRMTGDVIPPGSWQRALVPEHLKMTFRIEDAGGVTLAAGKNLAELKRRLRRDTRSAIAATAASVEQAGLTSWTIGALPRVIETERGGQPVRAYPALVDERHSVAVRLFGSEQEQQRAMWGGTRRLLLLSVASPAKALERILPNTTKLAFGHAPHATVADVYDDCVLAAADGLIAANGGPAWDAGGFEILRANVRGDLVEDAVVIAKTAGEILGAAREIDSRLDDLVSPAIVTSVADVQTQLRNLVYPGFIRATGSSRLADVVRYLTAIDRRLDKVKADPRRDALLVQRIHVLEDAYYQLLASRPPGTADAIAPIRWLIEELRVSFFAQALGTRESVSEQRIQKLLSSVG